MNGASRPLPPGPEKLPLPPPPSSPSPQSPVDPGTPFSQGLTDQRLRFERERLELLVNQRRIRLERLESLRHSRVIVYYSIDLIHDGDAQFFYELVSREPTVDHMDLILFGPGGFVEPAFKIARLCQQIASSANGKLSVLVPYIAKSALTILALAGDEIVMGPMSELGPIDPQAPITEAGVEHFYPLLGVEDALEFIQKQIQGKPEMALLFMPLMERIGLLSLGTYRREIESSKQYATLLLSERMLRANPKDADAVSTHLTERYKRHAHVIDRAEARKLGLKITDAPDDQWELLWQLHKLYDDFLRDPALMANRITTIIETKDLSFTRPLLVRSRGAGAQDPGLR